jgi:6-phosphogluconolactonase/glucosamine-6-phosphate isomerase/deaminase
LLLEIADLIKSNKEENCVLGLATGSSPIMVYEELVRMHREEGLSFSNVITTSMNIIPCGSIITAILFYASALF